MGTVGYMSPEQIRGHATDYRSDIFSFGTILHEMITGKRAFQEETVAETMSAILKEEPGDLSESNPNISPPLERIVRRCLEKKPDRRFQSTADLGFALEALSGSSGSAATIIAPVSSRKFDRERLIWSGVCAVLLLFAAGLAFFYFRMGTPAQPVRLALQPPSTATDPSAITVSPDGSRVVFRAHNSDGRRVLWVRAFNTLEAQPLSGTEGAIAPFWSPDNRHVGYFAAGKLFRIDTEGGRPQVLCDAFDDRGGSWNGDGVILFSGNEGLYRINASGGQPALATKLEPTEEAHRWPYFLPDGRHFVFLADASRAENHNIRLGSLDSDETKILFPAISRIVYAPPGYLLFVRQSALFAQRFDLKELKMSGDPVVVADQIADIGGNHEFDYSVSDNGILLYQVGSRISQLTWYDRTGKETERFGEPADYTQVAAFSDSHGAVVTIVDPDRRNGDIWLVDFNRGTKSRITFDPHGEFDPHLSPDGNRVVFASTRKEAGWNALFQIQVTGEAEDELFSELTTEAFPTSWSPDGKSILFNYCRNKETCTLRILSVEGERQSRPYLQTAPFHQYDGQISPDGKWVAYVSEESGRPEIFVQSFPEPGQKRQISTAGGNFPLWRRDGREIFYLSIDEKVMAVDVKTTGTFESGIPQALFQANLKSMSGYGYAASADGQRFLVNTRTSLPGGPSLIVVLNWATGLKK
ncbi:MAG: protein kinase, partial [Pyrinomonadaceae bacterium]